MFWTELSSPNPRQTLGHGEAVCRGKPLGDNSNCCRKSTEGGTVWVNIRGQPDSV